MHEIEIVKIKKSFSTKKRNEIAFRNLIKSIKEFGQVYPIIVDDDHNIIKGNTLFDALKFCKYDKVYIKYLNSKTHSNALLNLQLSLLQQQIDGRELIFILYANKELVLDKKVYTQFTQAELKNIVKFGDFDFSIYKDHKLNSLEDNVKLLDDNWE